MYDSQATNKKLGGLTVRAPIYPSCTPIGRLGVICDSQPTGINKNPTINWWKLLLFD
jgi:hypothetical protein